MKEEKNQLDSENGLLEMFSQLFALYLTDKHGERFCSILTNALTSNTWKVQLVVLSAIKLFIERLVNILHS